MVCKEVYLKPDFHGLICLVVPTLMRMFMSSFFPVSNEVTLLSVVISSETAVAFMLIKGMGEILPKEFDAKIR